METVASAAEQTTDLLQKLSLDSKTKNLEVPDAGKKKYGSAESSRVAATPVSTFECPTLASNLDSMDPNACYLLNGYAPYYYGGYDGSINEWEDYPRYVSADGLEIPPGVYGDNGSILYHHGYGYPLYGAYSPAGSPVPTMGLDGQMYGPQHYHYGTTYYQPTTPPNGPYSTPASTTVDVSTSVTMDQVPLSVENVNRNSNAVANESLNVCNATRPLKPGSQNAYLSSNVPHGRGAIPGIVPSAFHDPRFGYDGISSPIPWLDAPIASDGQHRLATSRSVSPVVSNVPSTRSQGLRPPSHLLGLHPPRTPNLAPAAGCMNRPYPNSRMHGQYGNTVRTGPGFGFNNFDSRTNSRGWSAADKFKQRGRGGYFGYNNENFDGLNELNRGPRAVRSKNQKGSNITIAAKGQNLVSNENKADSIVIPESDQYNCSEFPVNYSNAKFFIIKSYSEDDIHQSVKYNVWSSTPNGNRKLDAGYSEASENPGGCPVFLFFSVNTSGQFVGVAEMAGPVDFNKNLDYWQQDKWNGCFPVKWHIVKDVPNSLLKHITLENNENKPVTNSRDTQEVKLEHGIEMLKIFKDHVSKTSILDDFEFYEDRQKTMQEKKAKQHQFHKQTWSGKVSGLGEEKERDISDVKMRLQKPLEVVTGLMNNENREHKQLEENGLINIIADALNSDGKIMENVVVAKGG